MMLMVMLLKVVRLIHDIKGGYRMRAEGKVIECLENGMLKVEVFCPLCAKRTVWLRRLNRAKKPYTCLSCGVLFNVMHWLKMEGV